MAVAKNSKKSIRDIFKRIESALEIAVKPATLRPLAQFTIDIVVKRTRLGYGVDRQFGVKKKLKPLSDKYIEHRERLKRSLRGRSGSRSITLSEFTSPSKSNLTLSGQMLASMRILKEEHQRITIGPSGKRTDTNRTNQQIANYQADQGRVFNRVSQLEFNQIIREFRRTFGDLLNKKNLIR